jgi:hypothetical protein
MAHNKKSRWAKERHGHFKVAESAFLKPALNSVSHGIERVHSSWNSPGLNAYSERTQSSTHKKLHAYYNTMYEGWADWSGVGFLQCAERVENLRHPFTGSAHSMPRVSRCSQSVQVWPRRGAHYSRTLPPPNRVFESCVAWSSANANSSATWILYLCARVCRGRYYADDEVRIIGWNFVTSSASEREKAFHLYHTPRTQSPRLRLFKQVRGLLFFVQNLLLKI